MIYMYKLNKPKENICEILNNIFHQRISHHVYYAEKSLYNKKEHVTIGHAY